MGELSPPASVKEIAACSVALFEDEIRHAGQPVIMRGLADGWPAVMAARQGDQAIADYIVSFRPTRPVGGVMAPPQIEGRFFYNTEMTGFNFTRHEGRLEGFLAQLLRDRSDPGAPAMAVQSEPVNELLPGFAEANAMPLAPGIGPRIWLGNRARVAPHYDPMENIAVCVAGRRRFTLFPPDQLPNLYPGPLEATPAGAPVSMVDPLAPDMARYPKYSEAWRHAQQTVIGPGDALYIPFAWWHGVDALEPFGVLVNYWWDDAPAELGSGFDAMLHAMLAIRHLPPHKRRVWKTMFDHYIFGETGDPAAHLPAHARGILGPPAPDLFRRIRDTLKRAFS